MDLSTAMTIAAAGMKVQSSRLRVTSENLANAESTAQVQGGDPYRRKTIEFGSKKDRSLGAEIVDIRRYATDPSDFELRYQPNHPAADEKGNVKYPNVNEFVELMDMREAQRSYEANLNAFQLAKSMTQKLIDLLR